MLIMSDKVRVAARRLATDTVMELVNRTQKPYEYAANKGTAKLRQF